MIRRLFSPTGKRLFFYLFVLLMSYPLIRSWKQKCVDSEFTSEEVDELYLIDHDEIMSRLTLKQEVKLMKDRNAVFNFRSWYLDLHWLQWCSESWCALCCSLPVNESHCSAAGVKPSVEVHVKYCCSHCKVRPTAESISAEWIHKRVDHLYSTIRQEIGL